MLKGTSSPGCDGRKAKVCKKGLTRSNWLNCVLRGDDVVYWVSIRQQWFILGSGQCRVFICLYMTKKVEIWSGVTNASQTDRQTLKDRATQLLRSRSGALITQPILGINII